MEEIATLPKRGRRPTGHALSSAERAKRSDDALVSSGGRIIRARLSPAAAKALGNLSKHFGNDKSAVDEALVYAETHILGL